MHSVLACLLLLAILIVGDAPASAHPESGTGMMGGGMMGRGMMGGHRAPGHEGPLISLMLDMKDQLGLSVEQVKGLRDLRTAFEKEAIQRGAEIRVAEVELRETLAQDQVDLTAAEALVRKIAGLRADLRLSRLRTLEKGKGILTPEQLEKFREAGREMTRRGTRGAMLGGPGAMGGGQMGPGMMPPGGAGGMGGRPGQY